MPTESIVLTSLIPAPPTRVYEVWLSAREHAKFTGTRTNIDAREGGSFTTGDGYITGANRVLEEGKRIVQSWRTTDFPKDAPDSLVSISLEPDKVGGGTELTLVHDEIPQGQSENYAQGWIEYYFEPLRQYFIKAEKPAAEKPAAKKPAAKKPAAKKPAAKKPAAKKPAAKKPASKRS